MKHPKWRDIVVRHHFLHYNANPDLQTNAWARLRWLKEGFKVAEEEIRKRNTEKTTKPEDALPLLITAYRALKEDRLDDLNKLAKNYDKLEDVVKMAGKGDYGHVQADRCMNNLLKEATLAEINKRNKEEANRFQGNEENNEENNEGA